MRFRRWMIVSIGLLILALNVNGAALSGEEILTKVDAVFTAQSTIMQAVMTTIDSKGVSKNSEMTIYTKKNNTGNSRTLIQYLSPAVDRGTRFLSLGSIDQMWMYLPKVEKTVRIAGSMVSQSMMNSDFSYEDLMDRSNFNDFYSATVQGEETVDSESCYMLTLKAKKGSAHYRQIKLWVRQNSFIPAKEEFYSGGGQLLKVSLQTDLTQMDGRTVPTKITFQDLGQKGHQTILTIKNIKFSEEIPERYFTTQYLEKGQ